MCPGGLGQYPSIPVVPHVAQNQKSNMCTVCSIYIHNIVQMNLGHPVTLALMSLNHPVFLAWQQVSVGDNIECFNYTGTCTPVSNLAVHGYVISVVSCIVYILLWQWWELQLQQCWSSWWWLVCSLQSSGSSGGKLQLTMIVQRQRHKTEEQDILCHIHALCNTGASL